MKKIFLLTLFFLNGCNFISDKIIPSRPIISIEKNAAIIQKNSKPFQLTDEYYEIFKVLKIDDTIPVEDLFNNNAIVPKDSVFRPLFNQKVLLQLAKQMMLADEQEDIDCIKRKLVGFANLFVGAAPSGGGDTIPCNTKSSELAAIVALLDVSYTKLYEYEPTENTVADAKVYLKKKVKPTKPTPNPCAGIHYFRLDMKIDFLNSQLGGNGDSANFTLIEQGYVDSAVINSSNPFGFTNNSRLHYPLYYKNIALSIPSLSSIDHAKNDISLLFDSPTLGRGINGICKNAIINKVYFFDNNCMLNTIYTEFEALLEAIVETPENGILLLEFGAGSSNFFPAERDPILFRLIQLASMYKNIIIIEPAGDGGINVAALTYTPKYAPKYNPDTVCTNNENNDSGAIMVGGAEAFNTIDATGTDRNPYRKVINKCGAKSNFGDRIDCFAQGEFVKTNYGDHNSSSAASAIIAGLAVDIQSIAITRGRYLTPIEMRLLLKRPSIIRVKQGTLIKYIPVINETFLLELDKLLAQSTKSPRPRG
jgi:hypothetical protein